jgi:hypothetical protein
MLLLHFPLDDNGHVDGVTCLWTAATNVPIVHPKGGIWNKEPWWNDLDRGKLIRPPDFSGNSIRSHVVAKQEELTKKMMNFSLME